jgi:GDPmannose 4,6-dehydratase
VTRKITLGVANIAAGNQKTIKLGNIESGRDWGHSSDYMRAAWMMLQHDKPDDYVVATGKFHTIRELLTFAFQSAGISDWTPYVECDTPENTRPHDVIRLLGDYTKVKTVLGWEPEVSFEQLINEMVSADIARVSYGVPSDA